MKQTKKLNVNKYLLKRVKPQHVAIAFALAVGVAFAYRQYTSSKSLQVAVVTAPTDPCSYAFSIPRPSPSPSPSVKPSPSATSSLKPTPSPSPSVKPSPSASPKVSPSPLVSKACRVSFELPDTAVCWRDRRDVDIKYTVYDLPDVGGPFYMQTDWYIAAPVPGPHHYNWSQRIEEGKSYVIKHTWPGIPNGEQRTVETHAGLNVVDRFGTILSPSCSDGMDYYWTKWVVCP